MAFYQGSDQPTGLDTDGMCGTYNFSLNSPVPVEGATDPAAPPAAAAPVAVDRDETDPGKWRTRRSTDPVDDSPTFTMMLTADEGVSQWGKSITFVARCSSNSTEAYANWNTYVGDDSSSPYENWKRVEVRIGDRPSVMQRWTTSTDHEGTFAPDWAGNLLKQMVAEDRLILRLTPYGENPITAVFDTRGMRTPLEELAETCNWSL